jgi:hypothetical protein
MRVADVDVRFRELEVGDLGCGGAGVFRGDAIGRGV